MRGLKVAVTGGGGPLAGALRAQGALVETGDLGGALARLGGLDCLVHVAGVAGAAAVEDLSAAGWDAILAASLSDPLARIRHAIPALRGAGGSIVLVAPSSGRPGLAKALAKYGAVALTETLARELRPFGVRVNTVLPGEHGLTTPAELARAVMHLASPLGAHITGQHLGVRAERSEEEGRG